MKGKSEKDKGFAEGLEAYFKYVEKCKQEEKKPVSLQTFFRKYDPITLEPTKGTPPLRKYVQRYQKEMRKLK